MTVYLPKIIRTVSQNAKRPCLRQFSSKTDNYRLYSEQRIVGYSCDQMYSVVSEVEKYHSFVPWCKKSVVKKRKNQNEQLVAELVVGFPPFGESYTSTVTLVKPYLVTAVCNDMNLFNHLKTVWKFSPIEEEEAKCKLDFAVSFDFRSSVHNFASSLFYDQVIKKNVKAFLKQAELRYGRESIPRQRPIVYAKCNKVP